MRRPVFGPRRPAAVAICLVALVITGCGDGKTTPTPTATTTRAAPVKASADGLKTVADALSYPLYWSKGETPATYELTQTSDGRTYIRYLPAGTEIGDPRPNFLTVGTYPRSDAYAEIVTASKRPDAVTQTLPGKVLLVYSTSKPTSAFFAAPGAKVLVEVYDPTAGAAVERVKSGDIQPIA